MHPLFYVVLGRLPQADSPCIIALWILGSFALNVALCTLFPVWGNYVMACLALLLGCCLAKGMVYLYMEPRFDERTRVRLFDLIFQYSCAASAILLLPVVIKVFAVPLFLYWRILQRDVFDTACVPE
jgi:hypothetical protein